MAQTGATAASRGPSRGARPRQAKLSGGNYAGCRLLSRQRQPPMVSAPAPARMAPSAIISGEMSLSHCPMLRKRMVSRAKHQSPATIPSHSSQRGESGVQGDLGRGLIAQRWKSGQRFVQRPAAGVIGGERQQSRCGRVDARHAGLRIQHDHPLPLMIGRHRLATGSGPSMRNPNTASAYMEDVVHLAANPHRQRRDVAGSILCPPAREIGLTSWDVPRWIMAEPMSLSCPERGRSCICLTAWGYPGRQGRPTCAARAASRPTSWPRLAGQSCGTGSLARTDSQG